MRAAVKEEIYVNHIADTVEIGNEFLARKFLVKNDKVRTCMIENKRMGKEVSRIIPETISEDFIIRTLSADSVVADIHSSDLFLQRVQVTDEGKNGKKLVFHYKGFRHQEVDWQVDMVLTLEEGKHYMRKYLEITGSGIVFWNSMLRVMGIAIYGAYFNSHDAKNKKHDLLMGPCRLESGKVIPEQVLRTIIKENMIEKW